jgi:uncharacterized protein (TIGR00369 family)
MTHDLKSVAELAQLMVRSPQIAALGIEFVGVEPDVGLLKAPYRDDLVGDPETGVIAGGVVTTLLNHTCALAIKAAAPRSGAAATLDLRIDYMRPARPRRDITARAHCYKLTHSIAFVRAVAYDDDPADPVATAQGAFVYEPTAQDANR